MSAIAQLRHLYANMINGEVRDTASAKRIATGLLGPAIEELERSQAATKECRHCGWMCTSNAAPKKSWYPLQQIPPT